MTKPVATRPLISHLAAILALLCFLAAPRPAEAQTVKRIALTNARIETVQYGAIANGTVLIENDRIAAMGPNIDIPAGTEIIDCTGLIVYPGMIDSGTQLGLSEVGSDPRTQDYSEIGDLTPHVQALTAVNPNSALIPVTRVSGVTTTLAQPSGGLFPGTASFISLHGYTPQQMLVPESQTIVMQFPVTGRRGGFDRRSDDDIEKAAKEAMKKLDDMWDRAELKARLDSVYAANPSTKRTTEYVPEVDALVPVVRGDRPLLIVVNRAHDIEKAIAWVEKRNIKLPVFSGVAEGWRVASQIAKANIPCVVGPVQAMPSRASDRYDRAYANAGLLHAAGVKIALRTGESENVRNLPYHAGFAAAYGLGKDEALKAVTINPADIFGVSEDIGSIDVGKKANLFVADGDPFETATNIKYLFINGYNIPMKSRQTDLYDEFLSRNPGLHN
jgi:imidazolonepropionase-like amidohydrolase